MYSCWELLLAYNKIGVISKQNVLQSCGAKDMSVLESGSSLGALTLTSITTDPPDGNRNTEVGLRVIVRVNHPGLVERRLG